MQRQDLADQYTIVPVQPSASRPVYNALTVDVEDWYQSTWDLDAPIPYRVVQNTERLLDLFDECEVKATFFVLGLVCEKYPRLIAEIDARDHELATHGYSHRPVNGMSRTEFAEDVRRSLDLIRDVTGKPVYGYRAPDFTIDLRSLWALEVLVENGIRYDSSVFPVRTPRYGIQGWYRFPHRIGLNGHSTIIEFPLSTLQLGGQPVPFVGGGYSRLLPSWLTELGIRRINRAQQSAVVYLHPYEIDLEEMDHLRARVPFIVRFTQGFNRRAIMSRIRRLSTKLPFTTMAHVLGLSQSH